MNKQTVILDAVRSPIGLKNGKMIGIRPDDLSSQIIKSLISRNPNIDSSLYDDLVFGCAFPEGSQGMLMSRGISLLSDLPVEIGAKVVNRFCGSAMDATLNNTFTT